MHLEHLDLLYLYLELRSMTERTFCHFGPFLSFYTPKNLKNQNFQKIKETPEDTIILHKCTKNLDHMLHYSWDRLHDRCNSYFLFWVTFCPYTLITTQKIKIKKK